MTTAAGAATSARPQDRVIKRALKPKRDWAKWGLATYFVLFLIFLYAPMILMAILSFQGYYGGVTFPFKGPASIFWWRSSPSPSRWLFAAASAETALRSP